jgi:hypothetical protein
LPGDEIEEHADAEQPDDHSEHDPNTEVFLM